MGDFSPSSFGEKLGMFSGLLDGRPGRQARGDVLQGLAAAGILAHRNDRKGLANFMAEMPGPFPRSAVPDDQQIADWIDFSTENLGELQIGPTPAVNAGGHRRAGPDFSDDHNWYGLGTKTTLAAATGADDTLTVNSIAGRFDDAYLFLTTGGGKVNYVNEVQIDDEPIYLGPGDFIEATLLDIELLGDGPAVGLYLGDIEDKVAITYRVETSATDVIMRAHLYSKGRSKSSRRRPMPSRRLRIV